jgi:Putative bacterial sensory transduction regulator
MPRYRFAWSNFPPQLLKKLGAALALDGDPANALRRRFGARPKPAFVQETWPTLLEAWLPTDSSSRQFVAEELHALGLGRPEMSIRSKQGQMDYLRSCRNAPSLREYVLAAFLVAGETTQIEAPPVRDLEPSVQEPPRQGAVDGRRDAPPPRPDRPSEDSGEEAPSLNDWVIATLKEAYELPEVFRDADGDIPLPRGSSMLYIRAHDGQSPFLEIFSQLIHGFRMSPEVYEAVNAINAQLRMAKAVVAGDGALVVLSLELLTDTLSASELLFAIDLLGGAADHFDTLLQKRFGGTTQLTDDDDEGFDV